MADKVDVTGKDLTDGELLLATSLNTLIDEVAALQVPLATPGAPVDVSGVTALVAALDARLKTVEVRVLKPEELPVEVVPPAPQA